MRKERGEVDSGKGKGRDERGRDAAPRTGSLISASRFRPAGMPRNKRAARRDKSGDLLYGLRGVCPPFPLAAPPRRRRRRPIVARVYTRLVIKPSVCPRSRSNREQDRAHAYVCTRRACARVYAYECESRFLLIVRRPYVCPDDRASRSFKNRVRPT